MAWCAAFTIWTCASAKATALSLGMTVVYEASYDSNNIVQSDYDAMVPLCSRNPLHPGDNPGTDFEPIPHRCYPILVAFVWQLIKETVYLPMSCLQREDVWIFRFLIACALENANEETLMNL